MNLKETDWEGV